MLKYLTPLGTQCLCTKYYLQIHLFGKMITKLWLMQIDIINFNTVAYASVWRCAYFTNATSYWTEKWESCILCIPTELYGCHKYSMLGLQNGLIWREGQTKQRWRKTNERWRGGYMNGRQTRHNGRDMKYRDRESRIKALKWTFNWLKSVTPIKSYDG